MKQEQEIDARALREQVKEKYREVALDPGAEFHFHTGRELTKRLAYDQSLVDALPDAAVESFAGVANPFSLREIKEGEKVLDAGSGGGFDCFIAQQLVGENGQVVGVDMTQEMLEKSTALGKDMQLQNLQFREGLLEDIPMEDEWADVVISNGVINLCADKKGVLSQIFRIICPGGFLQFADIANAKPIPEEALENIDLWTA